MTTTYSHFMPPAQVTPVASLYERRCKRTVANRISPASTLAERRYKHLILS